jgi:hypothetical protein
MDLEVLDQKREGDLVELVNDQGVGKAASVGHQMVSGNGSSQSYTHPGNLPCADGHGVAGPPCMDAAVVTRQCYLVSTGFARGRRRNTVTDMTTPASSPELPAMALTRAA